MPTKFYECNLLVLVYSFSMLTQGWHKIIDLDHTTNSASSQLADQAVVTLARRARQAGTTGDSIRQFQTCQWD
jgi:hypothetical protein